MALIQIYRNDFEIDRRMRAQAEQHVEQRIAVFATGQTHHNAITRGDHVEIGDCLAHEAAQTLGELVSLVSFFLRRSWFKSDGGSVCCYV